MSDSGGNCHAIASATPEAVAGLPDGLPVLLLSGQRETVYFEKQSPACGLWN